MTLFTPYKIRVTTIRILSNIHRLGLFTPYKIRVTTMWAGSANRRVWLFTPYKIRVTTIETITPFASQELFTPYKIRVTTIVWEQDVLLKGVVYSIQNKSYNNQCWVPLSAPLVVYSIQNKSYNNIMFILVYKSNTCFIKNFHKTLFLQLCNSTSLCFYKCFIRWFII